MLFRPWLSTRGQRPSGPFALNLASPLAQGLAACWPLAGSLADIGVNLANPSQRAVPFNGLGRGGRPLTGMSAKFDGTDDYLAPATLANMPLLEGAKTLAMRFWIDPAVASPTRLLGLMLAKDDSGSAGASVSMEASSDFNFWSFSSQQWDGSARVGGFTEDSTSGVAAQRWVDTVYTYDGTTHRHYVDGRVPSTGLPSTSTAPALSGTVGAIRIGSGNAAFPTPYFQGWLADVIIANRAWTPEEVWTYSDPATRWDLYRVPSSRVFFDIGSGNVTTSKTQTAIARIQATTLKTETATARLQATATRTETAVSRIQISTTKTEAAVARITATALRTEGATARLTATTLKTEPAIARVQATTLKTETAVSRVQVTTAKTQTAIANISSTGTATKTQPATARVQATTLRTEGAIARIQLTSSKTETAVARVQRTVPKTQGAISNIQSATGTTRTQNAIANLRATTQRTEPATARLQVTAQRTEGAIARLQRTTTTTQPAIARMLLRQGRTQPALANLYGTTVRTHTAGAWIQPKSIPRVLRPLPSSALRPLLTSSMTVRDPLPSSDK